MRNAMMTAMVMAGMLGCYGPGNPPPAPAIKIHAVETYSGLPVDGALCPTGSELVGGGCDCWPRAPNCGGFAVMAVCAPSGNGMIGVCSQECGGVEVRALCASAVNATVTQGLSEPDVGFETELDELKKAYH